MSIVNIYRQMFGRKGPAEGSVIDMAEHGRAGGDSDKQGFKYTSSAPETVRVAENSGDSNITYVGSSYPGADTSVSEWQIKKIDETSGTNVTFADGNDNYDNEWDERENLSYS